MNFNRHLDRNLTIAWNKMMEKYGEDFEFLNGLHENQLNFSDFIDNFVDKDTVADATIDGNANSNTKDICSLEKEETKSHDKLSAFNKIFYEIKKMYGLATAREWLETEWNGGFYLHDAPSATYKPYSYFSKELIFIKYQEEEMLISFQKLYNLISEEENYDENLKANIKYPKDLFVKDLENEKIVWTKVTKILNHLNEKQMHFIKYANGISQIVTEDHPIITTEGDIPAKEITLEHFVTTEKMSCFTNSIKTINCFQLNKDLGWLLGMVLSESSSAPYQLWISQKENTSQYLRILKILDDFNLPYSLEENKIKLLSSVVQKWFLTIVLTTTSGTKALPPDFIHYNFNFLDGVIAGMIDGDGTIDGYKARHCQIRITSRELLNQISCYLQFKDIFCGDRIPFIYQSEKSFQSKLTTYGIGFTLTNEDYFLNINSIKINEKYQPLIRQGNFKNKKYNYQYGISQVIENSIFIEEVPIVYDITTETGHFMCNNILSHNCYAYDLDKLVEKGLFFINNNFNPQPPKHLITYTDFVGEFVSWTSNRTSGACGLPSFLIYSFYFWKKDVEEGFAPKNKEYFRDQEFQRIIYKLNQPYLRVNQSAFTNFSIFDRYYLIELFGGRQFPDGSYVIDYIDEILEYQKAFMEICSKIRSQNMMTFPVLSFSLLFQNHKFVDEEYARWCSDHNWEWNDSNFFNGPDITSLSSCCRLINDFSKLDGFINSIGGTSLKIGSVKVNTINLMRIAYESEKDEKKYLNILTERTHLCIKVLSVIRHIISRNIEKGLLPNYQEGIIDIATQYCTIGINAMYEAIRYFGYIQIDEFGKSFYSEDGIRFASEIMDKINEIKDSYSLGYSFNVEAVPAERCAIILCEKDNLLYSNPYNDFIYSNQWIPLTQECSIQEKIRLGSLLDQKCGGGQISHINIDSRFPNKDVAWEMLNRIADAGVIYFAFNSRIDVCSHNHGFHGNSCPVCGEHPVDSYQRIVGFLTPRSSYSSSRKKEFDSRKWFTSKEFEGLRELG